MDYEIAEFGRRMGFDGLALPQSGPLALEIGRIGRLYLERGRDDEVLVYLAAPLPAYEDQVIRKALEECAFERAPVFRWSCGYHRDQLLLMSRLSPGQVRAAELEKLTLFLLDTLKRLR